MEISSTQNQRPLRKGIETAFDDEPEGEPVEVAMDRARDLGREDMVELDDALEGVEPIASLKRETFLTHVPPGWSNVPPAPTQTAPPILRMTAYYWSILLTLAFLIVTFAVATQV